MLLIKVDRSKLIVIKLLILVNLVLEIGEFSRFGLPYPAIFLNRKKLFYKFQKFSCYLKEF